MAAGQVRLVARWPVKSLGGEQLTASRVDERGLAGDRTHALVDLATANRRPLTARRAPRMLLWSARYPDGSGELLEPDEPPVPVLTAPDGRALRWDDPHLATALTDDLGKAVELRRDVQGQPDVPGTVHVTVESSLVALGGELGQPLDPLRFRPNLHVVLDAPPFAEERWSAGRLLVGDCELELVGPCPRCSISGRDPATAASSPEILRWLFRAHDGFFGIYARALGPGVLTVGAPVTVLA
ncbi:MAG: MOSC domain-containing protein [Frankiaceae bacterium]